ncbi:MAG: hypothetical protein QOF71_507 [Candidatus Eremiobacteraeota bacterium]|nr:hypothetical protein [Candidatus Eremiobacteraeota bacterium]
MRATELDRVLRPGHRAANGELRELRAFRHPVEYAAAFGARAGCTSALLRGYPQRVPAPRTFRDGHLLRSVETTTHRLSGTESSVVTRPALRVAKGRPRFREHRDDAGRAVRRRQARIVRAAYLLECCVSSNTQVVIQRQVRQGRVFRSDESGSVCRSRASVLPPASVACKTYLRAGNNARYGATATTAGCGTATASRTNAASSSRSPSTYSRARCEPVAAA